MNVKFVSRLYILSSIN